MVDARDNFEETPLMMGADFGHSRTVQVLLQAGADPSLVNRDGLSAEGLASKEHYEEMISILREAAQPAIPLPPAAPNQACPACHHLATPPQMCILCYDAQVEVAFVPCGHANCCQKCADKLKPKDMCPICRGKCQPLRLYFPE